ncbi:MAG: polysaccharide deacetylase family protein [Clostridiales bacterium]|nr:polysaccharide deacetylase family protein [Clostridiales bacterium]
MNKDLTESETSEAKKIALTFDDGPDGVYTPLLLDGLRERGVHATFFLLGKQIELYPEIVQEMCANGHEIGIHSYEHVDLESLSEAAACEQIQKTGDRICELTGEWPSFVRPPYGNWLSVLDNDFCLVTVMWNVDPLDWATDDTAVITQRILENTEEYDIILLHDASASSVEAAFQVIDELSRENYEFVTVEELVFP